MDILIKRKSNVLMFFLLLTLFAAPSYSENKRHNPENRTGREALLPSGYTDDNLPEKKPIKSTKKETPNSTDPIIVLLLVGVSALVIAIGYKYQKEKKKNELLNKKIESSEFICKLYKLMSEESAALEKKVDSLSITHGLKEKTAGYHLIQKAIKSTKAQTHENLNKLTVDFIERKSPDTKITKTLNFTDLMLVSLSICKHEFKDSANLLGITTNALHMRRQRLKEKLKNAGISDNDIDKIITHSTKP